MRPSRRRRSESPEGGSDNWLTTYGDLVTLLLCFFIVLFSFSNLDVERFRAIVTAFQGAVGILDSGTTLTSDLAISGGDVIESQLVTSGQMTLSDMQPILQRLENFRRDEGLETSLSFDVNERGVVIHFADRVLFDLGEASLRPEAEQVLGRLAADVISAWPNHIRVEGHTDNLPISNERFPSNWELSTARAARVVRFLGMQGGLDPARLSAAGYAEHRPIASNQSAQGRARNRRVDIVLLRSEHSASEPAAIFSP